MCERWIDNNGGVINFTGFIVYTSDMIHSHCVSTYEGSGEGVRVCECVCVGGGGGCQ